MPDPAQPAAGRRIAIVRLTSLGDVIHTLPVAAAIRDRDPTARILWLAEERERILLDGNPVVDAVISVPLRRWRRQLTSPAGIRRTLHELRDLTGQLRSERIDAAIDVQGWPHKTSPVVRATRAPVRIGFDRRHARHPLATWFTTHRVTPPASAEHVVDQNLALLEPLGLGIDGPPRFPFPRYPEADERAQEWLRRHGATNDRTIVVLLPSTRGRAKLWPAPSYNELARRLLKDPSVIVLILGGPGEEALLETVRRGLPEERAFVFAPEPIPELAGVIRRAHITIGNDTGPLHVAAASGVKALGLFGPTRGARNGPYGPDGAYIQSPTGRMSDITVDEVVAAAGRIWPARAARLTSR
jgi:heptosyltransferase-1